MQCEWLLSGGYNKGPDLGLNDELDPESPVYKAILSNPVVQLGISNPKSLLGQYLSRLLICYFHFVCYLCSFEYNYSALIKYLEIPTQIL